MAMKGLYYVEKNGNLQCYHPGHANAFQTQRMIYNPRAFMSGNLYQYQFLNEISRGAYGVVCRARDKITGEIVAIKKEFSGLSKSTIREISILKSLNQHPCVVKFKQVVRDGYGGVYVVMEYVESDLTRLMKIKIRPFSLCEVKHLMRQLLEGMKFLHSNCVMHRDLKPSNLLLNDMGQLKICDFGLSRQFKKRVDSYSPTVVTQWYRAPELLLGSEKYSSAIDMWSVGCIMAELILNQVLFPGKSEIHQIKLIYTILGTPDDNVWPGFSGLPGSFVTRFARSSRDVLRLIFDRATTFLGAPKLTEMGMDLLKQLLNYDPERRITAEAALNHFWFEEF